MGTSTYLHSFHVILPQYSLSQNETVNWIIKAHLKSEEVRGNGADHVKLDQILRRFCLSENQIARRFYDCDEVDEEWEGHAIYNLSAESPSGAGIEERNVMFGKIANRVFAELYAKHIPSHLIHVTCTGYLSPSPAQIYFSERGFSPQITHAYHMGCYASLPAVRMGRAWSLSEKKNVDIIHNEVCGLHLNPSLNTPEQMVVQSLFADGHIKYCVGSEKEGPGLEILAIHEKLIPETLLDMTWVPSSLGMKMTLSREVPFKIRDSIPQFLRELCEKAGVPLETMLKKGIFAIHPGGPKIIESIQKKLELHDHQVKFGKKVLYERGNMSSATLPHVWNEILGENYQDGTHVLSLAFGPGLTIFGSIFEIRKS